MTHMIKASAPLALVLLAACGQGGAAGDGGGDMVQTNSGSIVMNDAQANQATQSENEQPPNLVTPTGGTGSAGGTSGGGN